MRRRLAVVAALGLAASVGQAAAQERVVPDSEARSAVGQVVTVEGLVASVHVSGRSGTVFMNFGHAYPEQTFTVVIFGSAARNFPDPKQWEGRRVRVIGRVQLYHGRPEIILTASNQLGAAPY